MATVQNLRLVYDVKRDYGATGNGSTNDATAIQNAINDAVTAGGGTVFFPVGVYNLGTTALTLPARAIASDAQISLHFLGPFPPTVIYSVIGSIIVPTGGAIIKGSHTTGSMFNVTTPGGAYAFSMIHCILENLTFRLYDNPTATAVDLSNIAAATFRNVTVDTGVWNLDAVTQPSTSGSYGVKLPANNNGAWTEISSLLVMGYYNGVAWAEHAHAVMLSAAGCSNGISTAFANHGSRIERYLDVHNSVGIRTAGGKIRLDIGQWAIEREVVASWWNRGNDLEDSSSFLEGTARLAVVLGGTGPVGTFNKNGGTNFAATDIGH